MAGEPAKASHIGGGRLNFWPLALVVLILGFALFGDRGILYMLKLSGQKADLVQQISDIEAGNQALHVEIDSLRGDRRYIERVARTELGMVRDDELVFQFSDRK
jgi:cell division protein FtsB